MHAIGYVVEVANLAAWQKIRQVSGNLPLYPIPGDGLASELGLKHYPALLSNRGIQP
jgi:integrating conjugative element protein (TIGR03765 family)